MKLGVLGNEETLGPVLALPLTYSGTLGRFNLLRLSFLIWIPVLVSGLNKIMCGKCLQGLPGTCQVLTGGNFLPRGGPRTRMHPHTRPSVHAHTYTHTPSPVRKRDRE